MDITTEVLIAGAGPAGLTAALLLKRLGVAVECVDKHAGVSAMPKARGIHARAVEILRSIDAEEAMRAAELRIAPRFDMRADLTAPSTREVTTGGATLAEVSPCEGIAISQDVFEGVLRDRAAMVGVPLHVGVEFLSYAATDSGVIATLLDRASGSTRTATCRYLIGADGWRSRVRECMGAVPEGPDDLGSNRVVSFRADLTQWVPDPPPAMILLTDTREILLRTHADHRWVMVGNLAEGDSGSARDRVRLSLGLPTLHPEVISDWAWTAAAQVTDRFADAPIFLVGDAAHRVPPAGATGISSAMADTHNLTWKLAAMLQGWGGSGLLSSYESERRPVAKVTTDATRELWRLRETPGAAAIDLRVLDMGYVYGSPGSLIDDLAGPYIPTARAGSRAPHAWFDGDRGRSTLDLIGPGFALLTTAAGLVWESAAPIVAAQSGVPLSVSLLDSQAFADVYELSGGQAVLIRPDGHVASRLQAEPDPTRAAELRPQHWQRQREPDRDSAALPDVDRGFVRSPRRAPWARRGPAEVRPAIPARVDRYAPAAPVALVPSSGQRPVCGGAGPWTRRAGSGNHRRSRGGGGRRSSGFHRVFEMSHGNCPSAVVGTQTGRHCPAWE